MPGLRCWHWPYPRNWSHRITSYHDAWEIRAHPGKMIRNSLLPYLPHLEYHELERCGHSPWIEKSTRELFFSGICDWLERQTIYSFSNRPDMLLRVIGGRLNVIQPIGGFQDLPGFGGHFKMCAIMRWEVFHAKKEVSTT